VLMSQVALGDSSALGLLYDRYSANVYALALRMLGDRQLAEELVQETFLRVWRQAATYRMVRGALVAWILSIARNLAIDELRRRGARPQAAEAHNNLGRAFAETPGRLPEAISEYEAALRIRPDYAEAHNNLGASLDTLRHLEEALAYAKTSGGNPGAGIGFGEGRVAQLRAGFSPARDGGTGD